MGLSVPEFYNMRCSYFFEAAAEFFKQQTEQNHWQFNLHRLLATTLVNVQIKQEDRLKPEELWESPFKDESYTSGDELSEEARKKLEDAMLDALNKIPNAE